MAKAICFLKMDKKPYGLSVLLSVAIVYAASPLVNLLGLWNAELALPEWLSGIETWMRSSEDAAAKLTELFVKADSMNALFVNILIIGVLPAIGEELLFRGVIQKILLDWTRNKHLAIWITAILFSALHLQFFGFLPRMFLGALFGYLFVWSGNLWLPVLAHFINNTTAVIAYYYYHNGQLDIDPDTIGTGDGAVVAGLLSVFVMIVLFCSL